MARDARDGTGPLGRWIRVEKRYAIYMRDGFACGYCKRDLSQVSRVIERQLDHIDATILGLTKGGQAIRNNGQSNLVTACATCNASKADIAFATFVARFAGAKERIAGLVKRPIDVAAARIALGMEPVRSYTSK